VTTNDVHGALIVDKPEGPTSHDVVSRARRALGLRQVGHTGTLDPMATGLLALVLGHATRLSQFLVDHDKAYEATVRFGVRTNTWDRTGQVTAVADSLPAPTSTEVEAALAEQLGPQDQLPPAFSAKKVAGVRAYELAREGREVAVKPARVVLYEARLIDLSWPLARLTIRCSSGFYVRALADTLGQRLGHGGCLEALRRTASGTFRLDQAVPLTLLDTAPDACRARVIPLADLLPDLPSSRLNPEGLRRALNGNLVGPVHLEERAATGVLVRLLSPDGRLVAVARPGAEPGFLHPAVVLK
jgi:tRNA pseudouridine55 synthase